MPFPKITGRKDAFCCNTIPYAVKKIAKQVAIRLSFLYNRIYRDDDMQ